MTQHIQSWSGTSDQAMADNGLNSPKMDAQGCATLAADCALEIARSENAWAQAQGKAASFDIAQSVRNLCADWSIEVTPKGAAGIDDFSALLVPGTQVYITHLPGHPYEPVIATAERLRAQGMVPVPHIVARSVPDRASLQRWLDRLAVAGVDSALLVAAVVPPAAAGPYQDTLMLLEDCPPADHGITRLGIAGHPEGHPHADREALDRALASKLAYAQASDTELWLVTQFIFDAQPLIDWSARLQSQGFQIPVRIGLPGPASLATLLKYAVSCGIGASVAALQNQSGKLMQMARPQPPVAQVLALAQQAGPWLGLHAFPFGGINKTADWFRALQAGRFTVNAQQLTVY